MDSSFTFFSSNFRSFSAYFFIFIFFCLYFPLNLYIQTRADDDDEQHHHNNEYTIRIRVCFIHICKRYVKQVRMLSCFFFVGFRMKNLMFFNRQMLSAFIMFMYIYLSLLTAQTIRKTEFDFESN